MAGAVVEPSVLQAAFRKGKRRTEDETRPNGSESLSVVPAPVDSARGTDSDSDSSDGGNDRVSGGDGPRHAGGDSEPSGRHSESDGEGK